MRKRSPRGLHTWVAHGGKAKTQQAICPRCGTLRTVSGGVHVYTKGSQVITERPVPCNNNTNQTLQDGTQ